MKTAGCLVVVGIAVLLLTLLFRPWLSTQEHVVQGVLGGMEPGRPCGFMIGLIDPNRIECFYHPMYGPRIRCRTSDVWITTQEVAATTTIFGIPFELLKREGNRAWIYQPKLDITFAVDGRLLVGFVKGKTTSDTLFSCCGPQKINPRGSEGSMGTEIGDTGGREE